MATIEEIRNKVNKLGIYNRHTLEKLMLGKDVTIFDKSNKPLRKITITEVAIQFKPEHCNTDFFPDDITKGNLFTLGLESYTGTKECLNFKTINYLDFVHENNDFLSILNSEFQTKLTEIENNLDDYILDNPKLSKEKLPNLFNDILKYFEECKSHIITSPLFYKMGALLVKDLPEYYIDNEGMEEVKHIYTRTTDHLINKYKKYIDKNSGVYKMYKRDNKFILKQKKKQKKRKKQEKKPETLINWKDIFKEKDTYKQFIKYIKKHIINPLIDYSYLFQKLKELELIHNHPHFKYINWLRNNRFISERDYEDFINNAGFRSLKKSISEQRENNFVNIFED
ncbi:hypothetical protein CMT89_13495 [Elizabethkingia anophelis]|uniref:Uncharacterized protein n=1 Tax=Elizabethkingia ursingii TaxID=1756150 RepID=A0AAJ3NB36_9FLAO|nr:MULTISPECIES: hypothetical protein [Elizabethkingia]AQX09352.1 hypothetical protein BBD34_12155 [Elizabethkingia ursingii]AVF47866.1 hypothetical protein AL491_07130 [Elizabethkingia anophelis]AVF51858.1 hypothetical protein AL492_09540 [Elizabethkingia anophelis]MBG0505463.1 hypothetical protein [Elizabethkingia anophelis]MCT4074324.1 hypothetical protein [Elizabethkingia anophelis]